jgi:transcriptional regulator with XRE-family HTH domain
MSMRTRLKIVREYKGLSQSELADKSGVSLRAIQAYEQGYKDFSKAQLATALKLADALECDVRELLDK